MSFRGRGDAAMQRCRLISASKFVIFMFAFFCEKGTADLHADGEALLQFLNGLDATARNLSWSNSTSPCYWHGVECTPQLDNVVAIKLPGRGLYGTIKEGTVGSLPRLQILSLRLNHLSGPLPRDLLNCTGLRKVFLQGNDIVGSIPPFSMTSNPELAVIDLSFNKLSGSIPSSLSSLPHLKILFLQNNTISGSIPSSLGSISQFNVSNNNLNGTIPSSLRSFSNSSFSGNVGLCGPPLSSACPNTTTVPSSPSSNPSIPPPGRHTPSVYHSQAKRQLSTSVIVLIVIADVAFLFLMSACCMFWIQRRNAAIPEQGKEKEGKVSKEKGFPKGARDTDDSKEGYGSAQEPDRNKLVFFHGGYLTFDLEDLLRASAEVLGKGTFGTSYKAVLEDGPTVVVKRLKEASVSRKEFEQHMDVSGNMRHRNLVPMRAYYYSKEEKLLVHEYLPLGSLSTAIHGILFLCYTIYLTFI
ncbi:hypothetical protein KP509_11G052000 [Ceratopteris richardii]|uniref:Protein kinase domain-containing protein n=2 Tax=Ceratopteris richardii TaxID=49495 RepID=A0A8T2TSX5_CERRI|nr:hypothetical protein KP509_11G052000 [Ceratopteris richardii]